MRSYRRTVAIAGAVMVGICALHWYAMGWTRGLEMAVPSWLWFFFAARWARGQLTLVRPHEKARLYDRFLFANALTMFRLLATPMLGLSIALNEGGPLVDWSIFGFFILCASTDILDGWVARSRNQQSVFGRMYDHITDIIFGTLVSVALWWAGHLPSWFFVLCLVRFLLPVLGGGWLFFQQVAWRIEPSIIGKVTVSSLALLALFYLLPVETLPYFAHESIQEILLDISAFLIGINLVYLLRRGISILNVQDGPRKR